jgi:MFS family permease
VARASTAAWSALAILTGLNLFNYLDRYVMAAVLPPLQKSLALSDGDAGWAASAFMLGYFVSAPFFGYLGDRFPRKFLMLGGVLIWSLATAASGLAHSFGELFAIRTVVGVGEACFVTLGPSWISDIFAATRRNTALTLFYIAIPVGSAIGFTLGGWFAQHGDWRGAFYYAGLPGVLLAISLLFLREPRRGESDGVGTGTTATGVSEVFKLLVNRRYNLLIGGYAALTFSIGAFGVWGPSFLNRIHHYPIGFASSVFGAMLAGAGLVATLVGGFTANALRRRFASGYVIVMAASLIFAAPISFFALMTANGTFSLVGMGVSMFFLFLPSGPISSEIFEIVPVHLRSSAMAVCTFAIHLFGDFGSPTIVGNLSAQAGGNLQRAVLLLPCVLVLGAMLWCTLIYYTRQPLKVEA